jgi:hypothetical protein
MERMGYEQLSVVIKEGRKWARSAQKNVGFSEIKLKNLK